MKPDLQLGFCVGEFHVEPLRGQVRGPGGTSHMQPKVMDVLVHLATQSGQLVERDDLLQCIWGRPTSDEVLTRCISELRRALGDDRGRPRYIQTVPKRGYRFLQAIEDVARPTSTDQDRSTQSATHPGQSSNPPFPSAAIASVAVLPFQILTKDQQNAHLADAFASELQRSLARVDRLRVASRRSAYVLRDADLDVREIGKRLGVRYLISGTLQLIDDQLRVIAELDDAEFETQVWAQNFDRSIEDLLTIERELAEAVVGSFATQRQVAEMKSARNAAASNLDAWGLVQKARSIALEYTVDALMEAAAPLRTAIELDPDYAAAHATLAMLTVERLVNGLADDPSHDEVEALQAAEKALALAPRDPFILKMTSLVWLYLGDANKSIGCLRKSVELAPFDFGTWGYMGWPLTATGAAADLEELNRILDHLLEVNPEHPGAPFWQYHRSVARTCAGTFDAAIAPIQEALESIQSFAIGWMHYANVLGQLGRKRDAAKALQRCQAINPAMTVEHFAALVGKLSASREVIEARTGGLLSQAP